MQDPAVATFGAGEVAAAATEAARVAHVALADCVRWRIGAMDPRLTDLLPPSPMTKVTEELDRPPGTAMSLLTTCRGTTARSPPPLRYLDTVDVASGASRLQLTGSFVVDVAFGHTRIQAGQDRVFTSQRSDRGWRLAGATTVANVNWAPARPS